MTTPSPQPQKQNTSSPSPTEREKELFHMANRFSYFAEQDFQLVQSNPQMIISVIHYATLAVQTLATYERKCNLARYHLYKYTSEPVETRNPKDLQNVHDYAIDALRHTHRVGDNFETSQIYDSLTHYYIQKKEKAKALHFAKKTLHCLEKCNAEKVEDYDFEIKNTLLNIEHIQKSMT